MNKTKTMKALSISLLCLLFSLSLIAQKKLLNNLDTIKVSNAYLKYTTDDFFKSGLIDKPIDPENIDANLLAATIFHNINRRREKRKRSTLKYNENLHQIANNYSKYYRGKQLTQKRYKTKYLQWIADRLDYSGKFIHISGHYSMLMNYKINLGSYFYHTESETEERFFYGKKSYLKKPKKKHKIKPIKSMSYAEFGILIERSLKSIFQVKTYADMACHVEIEHNNPNRIPKAKVVIMIGGYRLGLLQNQ